MTETEPGKLADHLESEADDLEQRSRKLEEQIHEAAQDWQRKRSDPGVPGAPPPAGDEEGEPPTGALTGEGDED